MRQSAMALALAATGDFLAAPAQPAVSALIGAVQGSRSSAISGSSSGGSGSGSGDRKEVDSSWLRAAPRLDASQCMEPPEPFSSITSGPLLVGSVAGSGTTGVLSELQMVRYPSLGVESVDLSFLLRQPPFDFLATCQPLFPVSFYLKKQSFNLSRNFQPLLPSLLYLCQRLLVAGPQAQAVQRCGRAAQQRLSGSCRREAFGVHCCEQYSRPCGAYSHQFI